jgi:hypothetical protein
MLILTRIFDLAANTLGSPLLVGVILGVVINSNQGNHAFGNRVGFVGRRIWAQSDELRERL